MSNLTSAEKSLLGSRPHNTKLWLSVYEPTTIFSAQLNNASAAKNDRFLPFDNEGSYSYSDIEYGMTMLVGTASGGDDKGKVRVRSSSATGIIVAENSYIDWQDDDYMTVLDFHEIQAVFPRIISDPNDATKTIWYKDYDIEYTNQNDVLGAFINMGSHVAGFLDDGSFKVYYTATGTSHLIPGTSLTYYWLFSGSATPNTNLSPGWITYTSPGHYVTKLIVSGSNGSSDVSYRYISVYDRPDEGSNTPVLNWQLTKLSGGRDSGGYTANIRLLGNYDADKIKEGNLLVIFSDDWYAGTKQSIGGNGVNRQNIVLVGYIMNGSITYNWKDKYIDFEVASPIGLMKVCKGFSISLEDHPDPVGTATADPGNYPSAWALIPNMNVEKAIYHYLRYHSTVLQCTDFQFLGTDQKIQYFDADRESLYNVIDTGIRGILIGKAVCDRQGKIWAETDPYIETKTTNDFVIKDEDWINEPSIDISNINTTSFIEIGGIYYTGVTGSSIPYLAGAPGESPSYQGDIERIQGLALSSQAHLNTIAGNLYAYRNREYQKITFSMAGNYGLFDIAPLERFYLNVPAKFNPKGTAITGYFYVNGITWNYNAEKETFYPNIDFDQIETGTMADAMEIPPVPDTSGYNVPPFKIPPIVIPPFEIPGAQGGGDLLVYPQIWKYPLTSTTVAVCFLLKSQETIAKGACLVPSGKSSASIKLVFNTFTDPGAVINIINSVFNYNATGELIDTFTYGPIDIPISSLTLYYAITYIGDSTVSSGGLLEFTLIRNPASDIDSAVKFLGWIVTFS